MSKQAATDDLQLAAEDIHAAMLGEQEKIDALLEIIQGGESGEVPDIKPNDVCVWV